MWDGPGPGPRQRGGPPFRGNHRGEMFGGRNPPMPNFRGRDDMNMGSMGLMGPRPLDLPPMDMRRMDGPPMRGRSMEPCDMRGGEANREAARWGEKPDFSLRKQLENSIREKLMNNTGFMGPNRNLAEMEGRGNGPWDQHNKFSDSRDRDSFHPNVPQFNNPNGDGRRGFPSERMNAHEGFRDRQDPPPMGSGDGGRFDMPFPPHERRRMDFDRRGGPPFNSRGEFDSDMDFRNRPESSGDFRARDRSPIRFGGSNVGPVDHRGSDVSSVGPGPQLSGFPGPDEAPRDRTRHESSGSPLMDYRCGEEMTLAEEWKSRQKDKSSFVKAAKGIGEMGEPSFPVGFGRDVNVRDSLPFQDRGRPSGDFPRNDMHFPRDGHFPVNNSPPIGGNGPQENPPLARDRFTAPFGRNNDGKRWMEDRHPKDNQSKSQERGKEPGERFEGLDDGQCSTGTKMGLEHDFQSSSSSMQVKDQDYRDIDYRTGSVRTFEYKPEELPPTEKLIPESKPAPPSKFSESGCQDQDYRSASLEEKVSNTISIIGIPKTATMEQILGAFVVRDGVPLQGMKVKNVVPGYSYDTAYVEFLNLEDAVHFMESNKGSLKVGTRTAFMKFVQPDKQERVHELAPKPQDPQLPPLDVPSENFTPNLSDPQPRAPVDPPPHDLWPRNSDLTPEAWQQQVDQQQQQQDREQQESWGGGGGGGGLPPHSPLQSGSVFKDSKTLIIKNVKATTSVETILKALDPYAYLDERNVRLVKGKTPGAKCFCFVDMDSHEQVTRLVELLTKPRPLYIDGVRVYAEVAKPLKNQNLRRDFDKPNSSILGCPPETSMVGLHQYSQPQQYPLPVPAPPAAPGAPAVTPGHVMGVAGLSSDLGVNQGHGYDETRTVDPSFHAAGPQAPAETTGLTAAEEAAPAYSSGSEVPDMSSYLYDSTSGFYYDPETTLYYDPNSRYFYNAQTQDYLYWDPGSKTYVPVPGGASAETPSVTMTAEDRAILSNPAADAPLEMRKPSDLPPPTDTGPVQESAPEPPATSAADKKEEEEAMKKDKDEKPKSLAAVKIMKDMERWAKIQNRQKESVRAPSPVLKTGPDDDRKQSKSADAAFAIFERKVSGGDDLFKKPMAPPKKDEKSKRPMGSLGMLVSDYGAGSDEEVEEEREEEVKSSQSSQGVQPKDREDKLTDWKKMACLLCRRQFPNKDALIRHQQLSNLHKQNMEIHLKIKRSKKELEALENQEREVKKTSKVNTKETRSPDQKRKKHHQHQQHWAEGPREGRGVSERPGLGAEPVQRKKKEPVVWDSGAYKQLCRKAMYARFKELE